MIDTKMSILPRRITVASVKNKGGSGGSMLAMATATVLRMSGGHDFTTVLVDLDGSTGTTMIRMGERDAHGELLLQQSFEAGVLPVNLFDRHERARLFEVIETDDRFVILDGPAASINMFRELTENLGARDFVEHNRSCGRELVVMVPISPRLPSIVDVRDAIDTFGPDAHYVVVRTMHGCSPADYVLWDEPDFTNSYGKAVSGRSKARLSEVGGSIIDMPPLTAGVLARAEALQVTFAEAITSTSLRSAERISVRTWLGAWAAQLEKIRGPLGLGNDFVWTVK